jgi:hypothetical protein
MTTVDMKFKKYIFLTLFHINLHSQLTITIMMINKNPLEKQIVYRMVF